MSVKTKVPLSPKSVHDYIMARLRFIDELSSNIRCFGLVDESDEMWQKYTTVANDIAGNKNELKTMLAHFFEESEDALKDKSENDELSLNEL